MRVELLSGIEKRIQVVRGLRVMVDVDLAALYGVPSRNSSNFCRLLERHFGSGHTTPVENQYG